MMSNTNHNELPDDVAGSNVTAKTNLSRNAKEIIEATDSGLHQAERDDCVQPEISKSDENGRCFYSVSRNEINGELDNNSTSSNIVVKNEKDISERAGIHSVSQVRGPRKSCISDAPTTPRRGDALPDHSSEEDLFVAPSAVSNQCRTTQNDRSAKPTLTQQSPASSGSFVSDPGFHDHSLHPPSGDLSVETTHDADFIIEKSPVKDGNFSESNQLHAHGSTLNEKTQKHPYFVSVESWLSNNSPSDQEINQSGSADDDVNYSHAGSSSSKSSQEVYEIQNEGTVLTSPIPFEVRESRSSNLINFNSKKVRHSPVSKSQTPSRVTAKKVRHIPHALAEPAAVGKAEDYLGNSDTRKDGRQDNKLLTESNQLPSKSYFNLSHTEVDQGMEQLHGERTSKTYSEENDDIVMQKSKPLSTLDCSVDENEKRVHVDTFDFGIFHHEEDKATANRIKMRLTQLKFSVSCFHDHPISAGLPVAKKSVHFHKDCVCMLWIATHKSVECCKGMHAHHKNVLFDQSVRQGTSFAVLLPKECLTNGPVLPEEYATYTVLREDHIFDTVVSKTYEDAKKS